MKCRYCGSAAIAHPCQSLAEAENCNPVKKGAWTDPKEAAPRVLTLEEIVERQDEIAEHLAKQREEMERSLAEKIADRFPKTLEHLAQDDGPVKRSPWQPISMLENEGPPKDGTPFLVAINYDGEVRHSVCEVTDKYVAWDGNDTTDWYARLCAANAFSSWKLSDCVAWMPLEPYTEPK